MLGLFRKKIDDVLSCQGREITIVSVMRDARILYTGSLVDTFEPSLLEGKIFEVAFETRSGNPFFVYYLCPEYYAEVALGGAGTLNAARLAEDFRTKASQTIVQFLVRYMQRYHRTDISADIVSFSHNRAHTNVLAYVEHLQNWYPIQQASHEPDDAIERKVDRVNRQELDIAYVVAMSDLSPS